MIFSRILSILPIAVTMTLTVLPSSTHGQYDCDFLELIPAECQADGAEYGIAASCVGNYCYDQIDSLMPFVQRFLEDAENPTAPDKKCSDVNTFMQHMIETCGSCTESLVKLVDCAAEHETKMNEGSKEEIQTFINILKESQNSIGMDNQNKILEFIDKDGSCQNLVEGGYVIAGPPTPAPTRRPTRLRTRTDTLFDSQP